MDESGNINTPLKSHFPGLGGLGVRVGAASTWLNTRAPFRATFKAGSLTGSGTGIFTPAGLSPLKTTAMNRTPVYRQSGTSVDGEMSEFITPVMANPNYALKGRSYTDGVLRRRIDIQQESTNKDVESMRDTVANLSSEMDKQKQVTETLIVGINQKLMKEIEGLNCRLSEQEILTQKLVADRNSLSLGSLLFLICRTLLSWSPFHFIICYLDKEHIQVWLNRCLRYLVSFILFILFKSWARILGVEERLVQIEMTVYKVLRMIFLPFSKRTDRQPPIYARGKD